MPSAVVYQGCVAFIGNSMELMRWDFAKSAAFKAQFDHTRIGAGSPGSLVNIQPGFQPGGKVNVFSVTVDFIY